MNEQTFKGISAAYSARKIQNRNTVQLFINHSWRAPAVNELFSAGVHHGNASYEEGNAGLTPEWGEKLEFQWKKSFKKSNFELSTFGLWSPNYIHLNPQSSPILTVRGAFPHYKYEQLPTILSGASAYQEFFFFRGKFTALKLALLTLLIVATPTRVIESLNSGGFYAHMRIMTADTCEVYFFIVNICVFWICFNETFALLKPV
jgi:iron complex outermembrane receptor protein